MTSLHDREVHQFHRRYTDALGQEDGSVRKRLAVELVRDIDRFLRSDAPAGAKQEAERLKTNLGMEVFGVTPEQHAGVQERLKPTVKKKSEDQRELENAEQWVAKLERQLEEAKYQRDLIRDRPQDPYDPETYLIVETSLGAPRLLYKDAEDQWWLSERRVDWRLVRNVLSGLNITVYVVNHMTEERFD